MSFKHIHKSSVLPLVLSSIGRVLNFKVSRIPLELESPLSSSVNIFSPRVISPTKSKFTSVLSFTIEAKPPNICKKFIYNSFFISDVTPANFQFHTRSYSTFGKRSYLKARKSRITLKRRYAKKREQEKLSYNSTDYNASGMVNSRSCEAIKRLDSFYKKCKAVKLYHKPEIRLYSEKVVNKNALILCTYDSGNSDLTFRKISVDHPAQGDSKHEGSDSMGGAQQLKEQMEKDSETRKRKEQYGNGNEKEVYSFKDKSLSDKSLPTVQSNTEDKHHNKESISSAAEQNTESKTKGRTSTQDNIHHDEKLQKDNVQCATQQQADTSAKEQSSLCQESQQCSTENDKASNLTRESTFHQSTKTEKPSSSLVLLHQPKDNAKEISLVRQSTLSSPSNEEKKENPVSQGILASSSKDESGKISVSQNNSPKPKDAAEEKRSVRQYTSAEPRETVKDRTLTCQGNRSKSRDKKKEIILIGRNIIPHSRDNAKETASQGILSSNDESGRTSAFQNNLPQPNDAAKEKSSVYQSNSAEPKEIVKERTLTCQSNLNKNKKKKITSIGSKITLHSTDSVKETVSQSILASSNKDENRRTSVSQNNSPQPNDAAKEESLVYQSTLPRETVKEKNLTCQRNLNKSRDKKKVITSIGRNTVPRSRDYVKETVSQGILTSPRNDESGTTSASQNNSPQPTEAVKEKSFVYQNSSAKPKEIVKEKILSRQSNVNKSRDKKKRTSIGRNIARHPRDNVKETSLAFQVTALLPKNEKGATDSTCQCTLPALKQSEKGSSLVPQPPTKNKAYQEVVSSEIKNDAKPETSCIVTANVQTVQTNEKSKLEQIRFKDSNETAVLAKDVTSTTNNSIETSLSSTLKKIERRRRLAKLLSKNEIVFSIQKNPGKRKSLTNILPSVASTYFSMGRGKKGEAKRPKSLSRWPSTFIDANQNQNANSEYSEEIALRRNTTRSIKVKRKKRKAQETLDTDVPIKRSRTFLLTKSGAQECVEKTVKNLKPSELVFKSYMDKSKARASYENIGDKATNLPIVNSKLYNCPSLGKNLMSSTLWNRKKDELDCQKEVIEREGEESNHETHPSRTQSSRDFSTPTDRRGAESHEGHDKEDCKIAAVHADCKSDSGDADFVVAKTTKGRDSKRANVIQEAGKVLQKPKPPRPKSLEPKIRSKSRNDFKERSESPTLRKKSTSSSRWERRKDKHYREKEAIKKEKEQPGGKIWVGHIPSMVDVLTPINPQRVDSHERGDGRSSKATKFYRRNRKTSSVDVNLVFSKGSESKEPPPPTSKPLEANSILKSRTDLNEGSGKQLMSSTSWNRREDEHNSQKEATEKEEEQPSSKIWVGHLPSIVDVLTVPTQGVSSHKSNESEDSKATILHPDRKSDSIDVNVVFAKKKKRKVSCPCRPPPPRPDANKVKEKPCPCEKPQEPKIAPSACKDFKRSAPSGCDPTSLATRPALQPCSPSSASKPSGAKADKCKQQFPEKVGEVGDCSNITTYTDRIGSVASDPLQNECKECPPRRRPHVLESPFSSYNPYAVKVHEKPEPKLPPGCTPSISKTIEAAVPCSLTPPPKNKVRKAGPCSSRPKIPSRDPYDAKTRKLKCIKPSVGGTKPRSIASLSHVHSTDQPISNENNSSASKAKSSLNRKAESETSIASFEQSVRKKSNWSVSKSEEDTVTPTTGYDRQDNSYTISSLKALTKKQCNNGAPTVLLEQSLPKESEGSYESHNAEGRMLDSNKSLPTCKTNVLIPNKYMINPHLYPCGLVPPRKKSEENPKELQAGCSSEDEKLFIEDPYENSPGKVYDPYEKHYIMREFKPPVPYQKLKSYSLVPPTSKSQELASNAGPLSESEMLTHFSEVKLSNCENPYEQDKYQVPNHGECECEDESETILLNDTEPEFVNPYEERKTDTSGVIKMSPQEGNLDDSDIPYTKEMFGDTEANLLKPNPPRSEKLVRRNAACKSSKRKEINLKELCEKADALNTVFSKVSKHNCSPVLHAASNRAVANPIAAHKPKNFGSQTTTLNLTPTIRGSIRSATSKSAPWTSYRDFPVTSVQTERGMLNKKVVNSSSVPQMEVNIPRVPRTSRKKNARTVRLVTVTIGELPPRRYTLASCKRPTFSKAKRMVIRHSTVYMEKGRPTVGSLVHLMQFSSKAVNRYQKKDGNEECTVGEKSYPANLRPREKWRPVKLRVLNKEDLKKATEPDMNLVKPLPQILGNKGSTDKTEKPEEIPIKAKRETN